MQSKIMAYPFSILKMGEFKYIGAEFTTRSLFWTSI